MHCKDYKDFAKQNNIKTVEVYGEFGSGYACSYVYFQPESVIKIIEELKADIQKRKDKDSLDHAWEGY